MSLGFHCLSPRRTPNIQLPHTPFSDPSFSNRTECGTRQMFQRYYKWIIHRCSFRQILPERDDDLSILNGDNLIQETGSMID